jgi:hypothetical protein
LTHLLGHPASGVAHFYENLSALLPAPQSDGAAVGHRVDSVKDEVRGHFTQLGGVAHDERDLLEFEFDRHRLATREGLVFPLRLSERDDLLEQLAEIHGAEDIGLLARPVEVAELRDDVGSVAPRGVHRLQILADDRLIIERFLILQEQFAVADDRHQRVVEIVHDAAGHFAERAETFLLHHLPLALLQLGKRLLQLLGALCDLVFQMLILLLDLKVEKARSKQIPDPHEDLGRVERLEQNIRGATASARRLLCCVGLPVRTRIGRQESRGSWSGVAR